MSQRRRFVTFVSPIGGLWQQTTRRSKPVSELNLSVRARKCMHRLGINTLGELCQRTSDELLEAKVSGK